MEQINVVSVNEKTRVCAYYDNLPTDSKNNGRAYIVTVEEHGTGEPHKSLEWEISRSVGDIYDNVLDTDVLRKIAHEHFDIQC